jgi:hypothetical protein
VQVECTLVPTQVPEMQALAKSLTPTASMRSGMVVLDCLLPFDFQMTSDIHRRIYEVTLSTTAVRPHKFSCHSAFISHRFRLLKQLTGNTNQNPAC